MDLIYYLTRHLLTEPQVLHASGIDARQLAHWQDARLAPRPSYLLRLQIECDSFFGPHTEQSTLAFYGRGTPAWLGALGGLRDEAQAFALFAARYRAALDRIELRTGAEQFNAGLDTHLRKEWQAFLDGTYGLCTRTGLPEDIARKELATARIRELTEAGAQTSREELAPAIALLDAATSPFAPHERARSSRRRLVDDLRLKYQIAPEN